MSLISNLHMRRKPWAQTVLTVFMLAWLNLTLQQCVLAASLEPDCMDCVTLGGAGCNDEISCANPATLMVSASTAANKDMQHEFFEPPLPGERATLEYTRVSQQSDIILPADPPSSGPPLHVRYCVYLK